MLLSGRRLRDSDVIDIAVEAELDEFAVALCTKTRPLTDVKIKGISAKVNVMKAKTTIEAGLSDLAIHDPTDGAMYPKVYGVVSAMNVCVNILRNQA